MARGSLLGFVVGVIPGAGATVASLMSYSLEKTVSKTPERFGKGALPGLVGPESSNNAASTGSMVPLLTLGIPGSASTAVLLGAFLLWGLQPGPLLMTQNPDFAWGLIGSMYLGNVMLVVLNVFAIPLFANIAHPRPDHGADSYRVVHHRDFQRQRQHRRDLDHAGVRGDRLLHEAVRLLSGGHRDRARAGSHGGGDPAAVSDHLGRSEHLLHAFNVPAAADNHRSPDRGPAGAESLQEEVDARRPVSSSASAARREFEVEVD